MISLDIFSELLQVLYSAPLEQEQWQRFLTMVSDCTRSDSGFFLSANEQLQLSALAAGGILAGQAMMKAYNQRFAFSDPIRMAATRMAKVRDPVGVHTDEELMPNGGFLQTSLYQELMTQANLRYGIITVMALSVRRIDVISLWRSPDGGSLDADSRRLLELLLPHVQTALEVHRRLQIADQGQANALIMADANATATFILDAQAKVRDCNAAAEALLRVGDGLKVKDGKLVTGGASADHALERLVKEAALACKPPKGKKGSHALLLQRTQGKRPLQLIASPLPDHQRVQSGGDLLLLVTDPDAAPRHPDDVLHTLFGFTPAEIEVANGLLVGYGLDEIANLRRVSVATVHQQVKSMLAKTNTHRQVDMVRLFMSLPHAVAGS